MSFPNYLTPELIHRARLTPKQVSLRVGKMKREGFDPGFSLTVGTGDLCVLLRGNADRQESVVLIDAADYPLVSQFTWWLNRSGKDLYVHTAGCDERGKRTTKLYLHRLLQPGPHAVDHVNRNTLDNRRSNLRAADHVLNGQNRAGQGAVSGLRGVHWTGRESGMFKSVIVHQGVAYALGTSHCPVEAAILRDWAARALAGDYAYINFPELEGADYYCQLLPGFQRVVDLVCQRIAAASTEVTMEAAYA